MRSGLAVTAGAGHFINQPALLQHTLGLSNDLLAKRGNLNRGFGALKQRYLKLILQFFHRHRKRGLRHMAAFSRAAKVALLGKGYDVAKFC